MSSYSNFDRWSSGRIVGKFTVTKEFSFEAAHSLPHLPESHKCHRLHGHSYKFVVVCEGGLDENSWVVDYAEISKAADTVIAAVDHRNLNETIGCVTTAENLARWIFKQLKPMLSCLSAIEVKETEKTNVIYRE